MATCSSFESTLRLKDEIFHSEMLGCTKPNACRLTHIESSNFPSQPDGTNLFIQKNILAKKTRKIPKARKFLKMLLVLKLILWFKFKIFHLRLFKI